jgi:hypothetical protein
MIDASASNLRFQRLRDNFVLNALSALDAKFADRIFLWVRGQFEWVRQHRGSGRARLLFGRLAKKIAAQFRSRSLDQDIATTGVIQQSIAGYSVTLRHIYQRIDHLYFPDPYAGSVTLLWPQDSPAETLPDAKYWWDRICTQIEFREIPGNNVTCLTRHVDSLAQTLEAALAE